MNKQLKSYIIGILTVIAIMPLINEIIEVICGWLETLKYGATRKIMIQNKDISELEEELNQPYQQSYGIGFEVPSDTYEEDDWEEDKLKSKCGF